MADHSTTAMSSNDGAEKTAAAKDRRELVFAFVSPLGVDRQMVEEALRVALCAAEYSLVKIHVSDQIEEFAKPPSAASVSAYLERKRRLMDAGDAMRSEFSAPFGDDAQRGDAAALAAIIAIRQQRAKINTFAEAHQTTEASPGEQPPNGEHKESEEVRLRSTPLQSTAFLIDSLKHPDELKLLKRVYGPAFVSIGVHVPSETRRAFLLKEADVGSDQKAIWLAETLLKRDETGQDENGNTVKLGQDVADAFNETDFILDAAKQNHEIVKQLTRLVELVFGNVFLTPSREELGMFLARAAQVRSGSMARQIGAAIMRDDGSVVAVGTNEVPRPMSGGQYWFDDDYKYSGRDIVYQPQDTSDEFREEMVEDVLKRLDEDGALSENYSTKKADGTTLTDSDANVMRETRLNALYFASNGALRKALLRDNIDYIRAVHAEAAAIIDSARHGVDTMSSSMFTTTFPCHECARHIVAAGIKELVYLAPYPKSAVRLLFGDSIEIDPKHRNPDKVLFRTFVGVAPSRYLEFFTAERDRKDKKGYRRKFDLRTEPPHLPYYTPSATAAAASNEVIETVPFVEFLKTRTSAPIANTQTQTSGVTKK